MLRRLPAAIAILFVLTIYVFFASAGTFEFRRVGWDYRTEKAGEGYYASLAEGFRNGHLSMMDEPHPNLMAAYDPYTSDVRGKYGAPYLWDASYFERKYYLYFSPLPVLLFYLPFRWVGHAYPRDALAGAFFCTWAFLVSAATVWRALANRKRFIPLWLWIVLIGLGNVVPWSLIHVRVYEVAIFCGMAMTASWAYALVRFSETGLARHAFWMGLWLALAIAARTNLIVLLLPTALVLLPLFRKWRVWGACLLPLAVVALSLAWYNYARFRNPLETGITYQLTFVPMRDCRRCSVRTIPELIRVFNNFDHYLFWPPYIHSKFPFIDLQSSRLDPLVKFPESIEAIGGIAPLDPVLLFGCVLALFLIPRRKSLDAQARAGLQMMLGVWLILSLLATCWYVVARYSLDFWMLMSVATALLFEAALAELRSAGFGVRWLRVATALLACYSILACSLLGFMGTQGAFEKANPELFRKLYGGWSATQPPPP